MGIKSVWNVKQEIVCTTKERKMFKLKHWPEKWTAPKRKMDSRRGKTEIISEEPSSGNEEMKDDMEIKTELNWETYTYFLCWNL